MAAPPVPDHLDALREEAIATVERTRRMETSHTPGGTVWWRHGTSEEITDALLAGPLAPLVQAARDRDTAHAALDRVRAECDALITADWGVLNDDTKATRQAARRILRALDGGQP